MDIISMTQENFLEACENGDILSAKELLALHPTIFISILIINKKTYLKSFNSPPRYPHTFYYTYCHLG